MNQTRKLLLGGVGLVSSLAVVNNTSVFNVFKSDPKSSKTDVYIWGNGEYQARPDVGIQFKNFEPKLIEKIDNKDSSQYNFKKVYFGEFHEAAIDNKGNAYIWKKKALQSTQDKDSNDNERQNVLKLQGDGLTSIQFTKGFVWGLNQKGEVVQWPIQKEFNDYNQIVNTEINNKIRKIQSLPKGIKQIQAGEDHFVALTNNGDVYTMGDDTYGQCGQGSAQRSTAPPFYDKRFSNPQKVEGLPKITKIVTGDNHNLALSDNGQIYGWGSNSHVQLSNEKLHAKVDEPLIAVYSPIRLTQNLGDNIVTDIAAGENSSFIVTESKLNGDCEVFSCGYNINGQLGLGFLKHVSDISKIEGLSNYKYKNNETGLQENINVKKIECGLNHCMVLLNVGALMEWGQNEYGQLGNKKRVFSENPIIMGKFKKHNILDIACGQNSSAVITEHIEKTDKKQ